MVVSPRRTRAQRKQLLLAKGSGSSGSPIDLTETPKTEAIQLNTPTAPTAAEPSPPKSTTSLPITTIPTPLPRVLPHLPRRHHTLLLHKQSLLLASPLPSNPPYLSATLVFAQPEAGTAVCIHPSGLLLTCSHCIAETSSDLDLDKIHYLLFASGVVVAAKCIAWDGKRDLALLRITTAQVYPSSSSFSTSTTSAFPFVEIANEPPNPNTNLICTGHPGSEDLECPKPGVPTGYDILHVSRGKFRGYAEGQDVHDNEEIGALMHDCWTYWGHSGAPLVEVNTGKLVGVHSSWDDETGMRRGVGVEAIREFVDGVPEYPGRA